ncbi:MAG: glutamate--cysteine ligase [Magnetococcales bacterium]|nr:glutamate--cysteine ligase [Magnetococcales bacterium]
MSDHSTDHPVTTREPLIAWLESGCKPPAQWRVGTEHEKFGFHRHSLAPLSYAGAGGVRAVLEGMAARFNWTMVMEHDQPIALIERGADQAPFRASITLEPGGQLELSGAPLWSIHETQEEINEHLQQLGEVCARMEVAFLGVGAQPKWPFAAMPWMPKGRYREMRRYLPSRGALSLDMMTRTATVQANLDFASEADMVDKCRLSMALQPLATALFANSPFLDGQPNGFLSYRAEIWRHTDPDRCGWLPFVFAPGFGFARYVEYALDVPMLFLYRQGQYHDAGGTPFRAFLAGRLPRLPGQHPTLADWETHLSTLFPDVRLKRYLELRGADAGNSATLCALPAFWKGLLYDRAALEAAWALVADWSLAERAQIHREVPRLALQTPIPRGGTLRTLAEQILPLAEAGLARQGRRNEMGCDETIYLRHLAQIVTSGLTPAERLLEAYRQRWHGSVDPLFREQEFESFYADCQATTFT